MLLFITDKSKRPPANYIKRVRMSQIRKFTLIQLLAFGCVFAVTKTQFAIAFPVMIAVLVPLRRFVVL